MTFEVFLFLRIEEGFPLRFQILSTNEPSCPQRTTKPNIPFSFVGPFFSAVGDSLEGAETTVIKLFKEGNLDDYEKMLQSENNFRIIYRIGNLRVKHRLRIKNK
jgi:hypothetical protein